MRQALREFGGSPQRDRGSRRDRTDLIGYYEVHIEQGPALEARDLPLGVVTRDRRDRTGAPTSRSRGPRVTRGRCRCRCAADALCAAAEWIAAARGARPCAGRPGRHGRRAEVQPGASNVIPGRADAQPGSPPRRRCRAGVRRSMSFERKAERDRGLSGELRCEWQSAQETAAVSLSPELTELWPRRSRRAGTPVVRLPSGAGHDAAIAPESRQWRCCSSAAPAASAITRPSP